jgi:hypothetical protein
MVRTTGVMKTEGKDTEGYIWRVVCEKTQNENEA